MMTQAKLKEREKWQLIMEDYHSGDEERRKNAVNDAVQALDLFIWRTIWNNYSTYANQYKSELYQQGVLGVMEGLKNYDSTKGEPTTHFNFYILGEMNTFISEFVCCANHYYRKQIKIINECIEKFEAENIVYNAEPIAAATNQPLETVLNCLAIKNGTEGVISFVSEEYTTAQGSQQMTQSAEEVFFESQISEELANALALLDDTTATILKLVTAGWYSPEEQFAILGFQPKGSKPTKKELIRAFNMSDAEISRIIRKGLKELNKILNPVKRPVKVLNSSTVVIAPKPINLDDIEIF